MNKVVAPSLGLASYSCPHCAALASQRWYRVFVDGYGKEHGPVALDPADMVSTMIATLNDADDRKRVTQFADRLKKNALTFQRLKYGIHCEIEMVNIALGLCHSCDGFSVWINGHLVYPDTSLEFVATADMPSDVKSDFDEAAAIFSKSARGAAAMLRLAIQRLMPHLGEKGENLNHDIGSLVKKGLDANIQKALDIVRVVGNHAVHPGQIDLKDDSNTAQKLFGLVNMIVQSMISQPRQIAELFGELPPTALKQIEKRDS
jgi:hypothetical protein